MSPTKKYSLTPEHRDQLKSWAEKWIRNAMNTAPMTEEDRNLCRGAVKRLYRAANLEPPLDRHIIFVPSPFVVRFASGFAAWILYCRKNRSATDAATRAATDAATDAATRAATDAATDAATRAATYAATYAATRAATRAATDDATWFTLNGDMVRCAIDLGVGSTGLMCSQTSYNFWQGGNQWSAWDAYVSFFRHVAKLDINYAGWEAWETLSLHSGPRAVHKDFCMISDRPEVLLADSQNRPHCEDGPFCYWRDGSSLYSYHGIRVPVRIIEHPEKITAKEVLAEQNAEVRRVMIERVGMERFLSEAGARMIHSHEMGDLFSIDLPGDPDEFLRSVRVTDPSTGRKYFLRVPPSITRADDAVAWTFAFDTAKEYRPIAES
jgi:hypothetical protein